MSERDIYRYDIIIAVNDEDAVKRAKVAEEKLRKIFERISQHSRALNRAIGTPTINLNDNVTGQTQRIERVLSHIDSTIAEPETRLLDNTTDRITTIDSRLRNQDNITSIPEIMLEDNASNAAEGIERNLNRLNGTVVRPRVVLENESNVISTGRNATQNILAQPTDVITERNNSLASYTPRGYRAAGTKFWQNIDLDAIEDRDSVISRYHAGNLTQSQGYRAAGRYFWENVDLNRVESRDHIMALRESGDLRRYGTSRENFLPPRNRAARDENHQPLSTWGSVLPTDQSAMFGYAGRNTRPRQWGSALPTGQSRNNGSSLNNVTRNTNMPEQWGRALPTRQSRDIGYTASNTRNINSSRQWGNVLPTRQSLSVGYRGRRTRDGTNNEITSISRRIRSLNNTTANPSVVLRDTTSSGIRNITRRLNALDRTIANPEIVTRDRNTNEVVRRSQSKLRELTSRGWRVTITAVDKVSSCLLYTSRCV